MMILRLMRSVLLLAVLTVFTSCNGQEKKEIDQKSFQAKGEIAEKLDKKIWAIYQDHKGHYWFGSNGNGVFLYDGITLIRYTKKDGLIDDTIREIQGDKLGNVFIGTPEGVSKYDGIRFTSLKPIASLDNKWMSEPNDLWFNCNGNNLYRYDGENLYELQVPKQDLKKAFGTEVKGVPFEGMNNSPYAVYGIDRDKNGNMWFGTVTAGAFRYDGKSFLWIGEKELSVLPDGRAPGVRSMIEDKDGYMWLSNFRSKYKISDSNSIVNYEKLKGFDVSEELFQNHIPYFNSGLSDKNGTLWMTTYGGGVWKYENKNLIHWEVKDGETDVLIISIYQDHLGVIWLGSDNAGVYNYEGERFVKFEL